MIWGELGALSVSCLLMNASRPPPCCVALPELVAASDVTENPCSQHTGGAGAGCEPLHIACSPVGGCSPSRHLPRCHPLWLADTAGIPLLPLLSPVTPNQERVKHNST